MTDSIEKTEHYAIIKSNSHKLELSEARHFLKTVQSILKLEPLAYILFDLEGVHAYVTEAFPILLEAQELAQAKNGLLVCFHGNETWIPDFENEGLVLIPSRHEAIEYVFMDQLEKQFLSDEE